jgi:hypothetical protein
MRNREERTEKVPRKKWAEFFDSISRSHRGWLATVEEIDPQSGMLTVANRIPFEGIAPSRSGNGAPMLLLGNTTDDHLDHPLDMPSALWVEAFEDGTESAVEFEYQGGRKTLLLFPSAAPAETVDGLASRPGESRPRRKS